MIILKAIVEKIYEQAKKEAPIEACGYGAGNNNEINEIYPMTNVDKSSEHFSFDPKEQFAAVKEARSKGLQLIAVYHSHPASPARLSQEDIKLAYDPNIIWIIASLYEKETIKAFKIVNNEIIEEELTIK
ncbi:M67 family metallopeptidase [Candidatus Margulisiibacteriota bacterium]